MSQRSRMFAHTSQGSRLHKSSLILQDVKGALEALNLSLTASLALSIALHLVGAFLVKRCQVVINCIKFSLDSITIAAQFSGFLVETSSFFDLVFHILSLRGLLNCILLSFGFISCCCCLLCSNHLSQAFGEVRLNNFKHANDSTASTISR